MASSWATTIWITQTTARQHSDSPRCDAHISSGATTSWAGSHGITQDVDGAYRLQTLSHPALGRYWTWMDGPPAEGWDLTRPIARLWYACDGGLEWPGDSDRPRAQWTITDDDKRETFAQQLRELGHGVMVWDRRMALSFDETEAFLEWLGEPMPGSEYKWATEREAYHSSS